MLHRSFKANKCKTSLKLALSRIKLMKNKKASQVSQLKRELANILESGQNQVAGIRVEHVAREEKMVAVYDLLEIYCELIIARLPIIDSQKNCPVDLKEAVTSVIFAAPRCSDVPELLDIRKHFIAKYGKEFASSALELRPECGVSRLLVEKLSVSPLDGRTKLKLLSTVAEEYGVNWDPATFGDPSSNYSDLLNISSHLLEPAAPDPPLPVSGQVTELVPPGPEPCFGGAGSGEAWAMGFKDVTSAARAAAEAAERASFAARAAAELSTRVDHTSRHENRENPETLEKYGMRGAHISREEKREKPETFEKDGMRGAHISRDEKREKPETLEKDGMSGAHTSRDEKREKPETIEKDGMRGAHTSRQEKREKPETLEKDVMNNEAARDTAAVFDDSDSDEDARIEKNPDFSRIRKPDPIEPPPQHFEEQEVDESDGWVDRPPAFDVKPPPPPPGREPAYEEDGVFPGLNLGVLKGGLRNKGHTVGTKFENPGSRIEISEDDDPDAFVAPVYSDDDVDSDTGFPSIFSPQENRTAAVLHTGLDSGSGTGLDTGMGSGTGGLSRENKRGHVHPNLPDFDVISAHLNSLRMNR